MTAIIYRNSQTGHAQARLINTHLDVGRSVVFRTVRTYEDADFGVMVVGVSRCGRFRTVCRVADTVAA